MPYYAVARGRAPGIFMDWPTCQAQVQGFPNASFKKFDSREQAEGFLRAGGVRGSQGSSGGAIGFSIRPPTLANATLGRGSRTRGATQGIAHGNVNANGHNNVNGKGKDKNKKRKRPQDSTTSSSSSAPNLRSVSSTSSSHPIPPPPLPLSGSRVIKVWTDGASSKNGTKDARAGWGVWFEDGQGEDVEGLQEARRLEGWQQTNNRAEFMAIIRAIQMCPDPEAELLIFTDSQYAVKSMTEWQDKWRRNKWMRTENVDGNGKPVRWVPPVRDPGNPNANLGQTQSSSTTRTVFKAVSNRDLIRRLEMEMRARKIRPQLIHIRGHKGIRGNEMADRLAVAGAKLPEVPKEQWRDIEPPPSDDEAGPSSSSSANKPSNSRIKGPVATLSDEAAQREAMKAWATVEARKRQKLTERAVQASPPPSSSFVPGALFRSTPTPTPTPTMTPRKCMERKEVNVGTADVVDITADEDEDQGAEMKGEGSGKFKEKEVVEIDDDEEEEEEEDDVVWDRTVIHAAGASQGLEQDDEEEKLWEAVAGSDQDFEDAALGLIDC